MTGIHTPLIVAGDVHGDAQRLQRLFEHFRGSQARVILVGDYINRGPNSREVVQLLLEEKGRRGDELVLLRGNHEESLLTFLNGGSLEDFARHGGLATIRSYIGGSARDAVSDFRRTFPIEHLGLLQNTSLYYQNSSVLVSHAGFDVNNPYDKSSKSLTYGDQRIFAHAGPWPRATVVVGHYIQRSLLPLITENLIAIDTGCGTIAGSPLTAMLLPERSVFQF